PDRPVVDDVVVDRLPEAVTDDQPERHGEEDPEQPERRQEAEVLADSANACAARLGRGRRLGLRLGRHFGLRIETTLPTMAARGTEPHWRESQDITRLSPRTK